MILSDNTTITISFLLDRVVNNEQNAAYKKELSVVILDSTQTLEQLAQIFTNENIIYIKVYDDDNQQISIFNNYNVVQSIEHDVLKNVVSIKMEEVN